MRPGPSGATRQEQALEVVGDGIRVHWDQADAPDRSYEADFAWPQLRFGAVSLFFGKQDLDKPDTLKSRLELRYPMESFVRHLWRNSREFHGKLAELEPTVVPGFEGTLRAELSPEKMKAEKDHAERVNFEYMARVGSESCIDFYYMVPVGIAGLSAGLGTRHLRLQPVVRVQLTTAELLLLLDSARPIVEALEKALPETLLAKLEDKS